MVYPCAKTAQHLWQTLASDRLGPHFSFFLCYADFDRINENSLFFLPVLKLYYVLILGLALGKTPSFCYWSEYVLPTEHIFLCLSQ